MGLESVSPHFKVFSALRLWTFTMLLLHVSGFIIGINHSSNEIIMKKYPQKLIWLKSYGSLNFQFTAIFTIIFRNFHFRKWTSFQRTEVLTTFLTFDLSQLVLLKSRNCFAVVKNKAVVSIL